MGIKGREGKKEEKKRDSFPVRLRNDMIQMNSGTKQKEKKHGQISKPSKYRETSTDYQSENNIRKQRIRSDLAT